MGNNRQYTKGEIWLKGQLGGVGAQLVSVIAGLIFVPIALNYFGPLKFGIWVTISSIVAYFGLAQSSAGIATAALIASGDGKQDQQAFVLRESCLLLCKLAAGLILILFFLTFFWDIWDKLFGKMQKEAREEAVVALLFVAILYLIRSPATAFTSAFIGLQEVHLERFYVMVFPTLLGFVALLLTICWKGGMVMLACLTGATYIICGVASVVHFLSRHRNFLHNILKGHSNVNLPGNLFSSAGRFFVLNIAAIVVWNTDNLVISYYLGQESVTAYAVTFKLYLAAYAIMGSVTGALWPMFGTEVAKGNWDWVNKAYQGALAILPVVGGMFWIGGILFAKPIILLWAGKEGYGGALAVFALGGYAYLYSLCNVHATFLTSINATQGRLLWIGIGEAIANLALSVFFVTRLGIGGVALGTFLSVLLTIFWMLPKNVKHQTQHRVNMQWLPLLKHAVFATIPSVFLAQLTSVYLDGVGALLLGMAICLCYVAISWSLLTHPLKQKLLSMYKFA